MTKMGTTLLPEDVRAFVARHVELARRYRNMPSSGTFVFMQSISAEQDETIRTPWPVARFFGAEATPEHVMTTLKAHAFSGGVTHFMVCCDDNKVQVHRVHPETSDFESWSLLDPV